MSESDVVSAEALSMYYYLDENKQVKAFPPGTTYEELGKAWESKDARIVRQETVRPGVWVSTVFLPLDHNFTGEGPPIVFETMVFRDEHGEECERCSTWEEAVAMHERMVAMVRAEE